MWYNVVRSFLFQLDAESSHRLSLRFLNFIYRIGLLGSRSEQGQTINLLGLDFPNQVGLAAGFDKNGDHMGPLSALGFGFIEVGTVTPRPQLGNPRPRLFRVPQASAIINRMGFNNKGVDHLVQQLQQHRAKQHLNSCIIGTNIGKNFDTPLENAVDDYLICLRKVYDYSDYIVINVSSPNTKGLRSLQGETELEHLLATLKAEQRTLADQASKSIPLLLKIAPDLSSEEIQTITAVLQKHSIEGIIATNTTLSRVGVSEFDHGDENGGMSGLPLHQRSVEVIGQLRQALGPTFPIIGVGGIMSAADAQESMAAGADLIQLYSGFVYHGPQLIHQINGRIAHPI